MTLNIKDFNIVEIINKIEEEIKKPSYNGKLHHPTFLSFLRSVTVKHKIDSEICHRYQRAVIFYTGLRMSRASGIHAASNLSKVPSNPKFTAKVVEMPRYRHLINSIANNAQMEPLPNYENLMLIDQVWIDWISEAVARTYGFYILNKHTSSQSPTQNLADVSSKIKYAVSGKQQDNQEVNIGSIISSLNTQLLEVLIKSMGIDSKSERVTGKTLTAHEQGIVDDIRITREIYVNHAKNHLDDNMRFVEIVRLNSLRFVKSDKAKARLAAKRRKMLVKPDMNSQTGIHDLREARLFATREYANSLLIERPAESLKVCPRPDKHAHRSLKSADQYIFAVHPNDKNIESYNCECGFVHIGHPADS